MSLRPRPDVAPVPDDTDRVARAAFRRGNPYMLLRDRLGAVFDDAGFADLYPKRGQPAYAPWHLAFRSAAWTPWRAIARVREEWPMLRLDVRPIYESS